MSTARYLSLKEVGERIGTSNPAARGYHLPEPDALIGTTRGWLPETIDAWNAPAPVVVRAAEGRARIAIRPILPPPDEPCRRAPQGLRRTSGCIRPSC